MLPLPNGFALSSVAPGDEAALLEYLNNPAVVRYTGRIPSPFTASDAAAWIHERQLWTTLHAAEVLFAIRAPGGKLSGEIGVGPVEPGETRMAEVGYWLAQPLWGQGVMTRAVRVFTAYAFQGLGLHRLFARVFDPNVASWRVLEKNGYRLEGILREHVYRHEQYLDDRMYGLLQREWLARQA